MGLTRCCVTKLMGRTIRSRTQLPAGGETIKKRNHLADPASSLSTATIDDLSVCHPANWQTIILHMARSAEASVTPLDWQCVLQTVTAHPYFRGSRDSIRAAHTGLMQVLRGMYRSTPSSEASPMIPLAIVQLWREMYEAGRALMEFAELFELVIEQEEAAFDASWDQRQSKGSGEVFEGPLQSFSSPAAAALWQYYLSIPGRRSSDLSTADKWPETVRHMTFAFPRLLRIRHTDAVIQKCMSMCFNICFWVMNDNAEGDRCREAMLTLLVAYASVAACTKKNASRHTLMSPWAMVQHMRAAALESIERKTERLQFACSPGLFDVYTLAASLEVFRHVAQQSRLSSNDGSCPLDYSMVQLLLHPQKRSANGVWDALASHPRAAHAARYAWVTLGSRLVSTLLQRSPSIPHAVTARVVRELRQWASEMGQPLQLSSEGMESLWHQQACQTPVKAAGKAGPCAGATEAHWDLFFRTRGAQYIAWQCGCGMQHDVLLKACAASGPVSWACAVCVSRCLIPQYWECPTCRTPHDCGEPNVACFACGALHPLMAAMSTVVKSSCAHTESGCSDDELVCCAEKHFAMSNWDVCVDCGATCGVAGDLPHRLLYAYLGVAGDGSTVERYALAAPFNASAKGHTDSYVRCYFQWSCGCGADNSPLHTYCWRCSREHRTAVFTCDSCKGTTRVQWHPNDTNGRRTARCDHCQVLHPLVSAAASQGQVVACPTCHAYSPIASCEDHCPSCHSTAVRLLQPLLTPAVDAPWPCLRCGHQNPIRNHVTGNLCIASNICEHCKAAKINICDRWLCNVCGAQNNHSHSPQCHRCWQLHPAVHAEEVPLWTCGRCMQQLNYSWQQTCCKPGCGGSRVDVCCEGHSLVADGQKTYRYAPWSCEECDQRNVSVDLPKCHGCGHDASNQLHAMVTALPTSRLDGRRRSPDSSSPATGPTNGPDSRKSVAELCQEQQLNLVELRLLQAAEESMRLLPESINFSVDSTANDTCDAHLTLQPHEEPWETAYRCYTAAAP